MKFISFLVECSLVFFVSVISSVAQKPSLAIVNVQIRGLLYEPVVVMNILRKEILKSEKYLVVDVFELDYQLKKSSFDYANCFDRECLISAGKILGAGKVLNGSVEKMGERIIVMLNLTDVASGAIDKSVTGEYINEVEMTDIIIGNAVQKLLGIKPDPQVDQALAAQKIPVVNVYNTGKASGPRIGLTYVTGYAAKRLGDPENKGGYDMNPVISQFGYQFETQYYSAGYIQALIEIITLVGGIESKRFMPTIGFLNGFRNGKTGVELALGPVFWLAERKTGFYLGDKWVASGDADYDLLLDENPDVEIYRLPDNGGAIDGIFGLLIAAGKTFRSGNLNIPINVYMIPQQHKKEGWSFGVSIGFNVTKKGKEE